jgi:hypothetical protein
LSNLVKAGRNAISKFAPRAIQRASKAVGLIAGDDAARRAEIAGAFASVMATVGTFTSARRARRVLDEMERDPSLSFEAVLRRFSALPEPQRDLAEAEVRRMLAALSDAIATEAVVPMLRAIQGWTEDPLLREDAVSACRALRDLDQAELGSLRALVSEASERSRDAEPRLFAAFENEVSVSSGDEIVPLSRSRDASRLLRRLVDCDLARAEERRADGAARDAVRVTRRRLELLAKILV